MENKMSTGRVRRGAARFVLSATARAEVSGGADCSVLTPAYNAAFMLPHDNDTDLSTPPSASAIAAICIGNCGVGAGTLDAAIRRRLTLPDP